MKLVENWNEKRSTCTYSRRAITLPPLVCRQRGKKGIDETDRKPREHNHDILWKHMQTHGTVTKKQKAIKKPLNVFSSTPSSCATAVLSVVISDDQFHSQLHQWYSYNHVNIVLQQVTTDWRLGTGTGCTDKHTGTSAAAPLAAGMIALMMQARYEVACILAKFINLQ